MWKGYLSSSSRDAYNVLIASSLVVAFDPMPKTMATMPRSSFFIILPFLLYLKLDMASSALSCGPMEANDVDLVQFALNLEFLEAEFFLRGASDKGVDDVAPGLVSGPAPTGARKANLDVMERRIIEEFGYQEVGHLRAITGKVGGGSRPQLDLSPQNFEKMFNQAIGRTLVPPMDPYLNTVNYLLASYLIPYVGLVGYVGTIPNLKDISYRTLVTSLLGVEAGQDAVIRTLLYRRGCEPVAPYNITVAEFTQAISDLRNRLGMCGVKDEGVIVEDLQYGAENKTDSNILSADANSLSYARQPSEVLRIVYGTGNESQPGGFFPDGGIGSIARGYLNNQV